MRRENDIEGYQPYIKIFLIFYLLLSVSYILFYKIIASSFFTEVDLPNTVNAYMILIFVIIIGLSIYVAGAVARSRDISSRRKGFEALTGNDVYRYGSLKNTPAMLQTTDSNGRLIDVSDYWPEIFGFERDEVIGRESTDFLTEESRHYFLEALAPQFFETGICRDVPCQLKRKNGEIVEAILSDNVIKNAKGNFLGSHTSITNITKYRQVENSLRDSEEILEKIVYAIPDIFIRTDVDGNILFVNNMAQQKGLVIRPFNVDLNVYADYNLLKIIIRNLITNAIKYSNTGGVVGIFALSYTDRVEVCISDSGVGMNDEIKINLFKNGGYTSQKGTANEHGTGLGLLLCKEFVEKHNGNIRVESKPEEGSQFTFSLPNQ